MHKLQKICPNFIFNCLRVVIVYFYKKVGTKRKSYQGMNEFEEQQFSISFDHLQNPSPMQRETNSFSQDQQIITNNNEITTNTKSRGPFGDISMQFSPTKKQPSQDQIAMNYKQFQINLESYDPYYQLIAKKTQNLQRIFQETNYEIVDLAIEQSKNNKSGFKVKQMKSTTGFKFIFNYQIPCSYSFYSTVNRNSNNVEMFSNRIGSFGSTETIRPNLEVFNLSIKKIMGLGLQPRKFNYIKYTNKCGNRNWQVCISVDQQKGQDYNPLNKDSTKMAEIFSVSHFYEEGIQKQSAPKKLIAQTYVQINLHSFIKAQKIVNKGLREVMDYVQNLYGYAEEKYNSEQDIA